MSKRFALGIVLVGLVVAALFALREASVGGDVPSTTDRTSVPRTSPTPSLVGTRSVAEETEVFDDVSLADDDDEIASGRSRGSGTSAASCASASPARTAPKAAMISTVIRCMDAKRLPRLAGCLPLAAAPSGRVG